MNKTKLIVRILNIIAYLGTGFAIFVAIYITGIGIGQFLNDVAHTETHSLSDAEIVGYTITHSRYGNPYFYKFVKYPCGCEDEINITASEYYREVNKND